MSGAYQEDIVNTSKLRNPTIKNETLESELDELFSEDQISYITAAREKRCILMAISSPNIISLMCSEQIQVWRCSDATVQYVLQYVWLISDMPNFCASICRIIFDPNSRKFKTSFKWLVEL